MAKTAKVRIEFGAAMASTPTPDAAAKHTLIVLVYAVLVDGDYRGIYASRARQGAGKTLDDRLFELPRPDGYEGPWDATKFAVGTSSFYRQSFAPIQELIAETADARAKIADTVITERWAFEFEAPSGQ
jgi:hypothetical protein